MRETRTNTLGWCWVMKSESTNTMLKICMGETWVARIWWPTKQAWDHPLPSVFCVPLLSSKHPPLQGSMSVHSSGWLFPYRKPASWHCKWDLSSTLLCLLLLEFCIGFQKVLKLKSQIQILKAYIVDDFDDFFPL